MLEALCRQSSTTLEIVHAEDGPPVTQRTSGLAVAIEKNRGDVTQIKHQLHSGRYELILSALLARKGALKPELIYIGDPMCSWCFGFAPVIQGLYARHKHEMTMTLKMGGLHPGNDYVVEGAYRKFLRAHWIEIGQRTGQEFSLDILDRGPWIYDTEKACRALVTVRRLKPGAEWVYMPLIQAGFYTHNRDPHDPNSFAVPAAEVGIGRDAFLAAYDDAETRAETAADFHWARSMGVHGFPTVLVRDDRGFALLTNGYQSIEVLEGSLANWIASSPRANPSA